jgi:hypothetical protein
LTNLALLPAEVLQTAESRIRDRGDRKQRILTNLALLPAEVLQKAKSRIRDRGDKKQRILTNLANCFIQGSCRRQKAESETEETESREY